MEERGDERRSLRRLMLAGLRRWRHDFQPLWGRATIVSRFHQVRHREQPPVFVIEGIWGSGKSQIVTHLQAGYQRRASWWMGFEVDARVDLAQIGTSGPEAALSSIRTQLRQRRLWRRMTTPVWTPRFALLQGQLWRHRKSTGVARRDDDQMFDDLQWTMGAVARGAYALQTGGLPLVPMSRRAGLLRWLRVGWTRWGWSRASRWVRAFVKDIERTDVEGGRDLFRMNRLLRGLTAALAQDLAAATRRRRMAVHKIVLFIEAYHLSEVNGRSWVGDLADDLREAGADVMLVVSCRTQQMWSERLQLDPARETVGLVPVSPTVEIHGLHGLSIETARDALYQQGVPAALVDELAEASLGLPLALRLLGMRFGSGRAAARPEVEEMLRRLPGGDTLDAAWVEEFCAVVAPSVVDNLPEPLAWHLRAAAALRSFDRESLALVMDERFSDEWFDKLVGTVLVRAPRPSPLLPSGEAFRVRSFVRDFVRREGAEPQAERRWHERAAGYFAKQADAHRNDEERQFELRAEALFHRFFTDEQRAAAELVGTFLDALDAGRLDRSELLIRIARELEPRSPMWRAKVETMAGSRYVEAGLHELAEARFRQAQRLVADHPDHPDRLSLRLRVGQALASCLRHLGRFGEGQVEIEAVLVEASSNPVALFQATWTASLIAKDRGDLLHARRLAADAERHLGALLESGSDAHRDVAVVLGLRHLPRKRAHLLRHRADVARRAGRYRLCAELLAEARSAYVEDPEVKAEALTTVVESHLLRLEGDVGSAVTLADQARVRLAEHAPTDTRAERMALRCAAQARLASAAPESARAALTTLAEVDADRNPVSACVGHFGLGELERLAGDHAAARHHYERALQGGNGRLEPFERVYAELALAELSREAGDPVVALERIERVEEHRLVALHPLLRFWAGLIGARAQHDQTRRRGGAVEAATAWLERARTSLAAVETQRPANELEAVIEHTALAASNGDRFETVALLLP